VKLENTRRRADELFDRVKTGDQKALEILFTIYFLRLNDFAGKVIKNEVASQDIVQEIFVKIWERKTEIESINIEAYLFTLVRNRCIDYINHLKLVNGKMEKIQISSKYEELYRIDFVGDDPYLLIEKEINLKMDKTIQNLPERCREVFILSRMNGLKNREIAEKLQINIKNVERHLSRALFTFRKDFSESISFILIFFVLKNTILL
jgi:RNA polymerase sigma-70 factor (ECF subfamily)